MSTDKETKKKKNKRHCAGKSSVKSTTIGKPVEQRGRCYTSIYVRANNCPRNRGQIRPEAVLKSSYLIRSVRVPGGFASRFRGGIMAVCEGINHWTARYTRHRHACVHIHARFTRVDTAQGTKSWQTRSCNFEPSNTYAARTLIDPILRFVMRLLFHTQLSLLRGSKRACYNVELFASNLKSI